VVDKWCITLKTVTRSPGSSTNRWSLPSDRYFKNWKKAGKKSYAPLINHLCTTYQPLMHHLL